MESQPQNPEFKNNPESFHPCTVVISVLRLIVIFTVGKCNKTYMVLLASSLFEAAARLNVTVTRR